MTDHLLIDTSCSASAWPLKYCLTAKKKSYSNIYSSVFVKMKVTVLHLPLECFLLFKPINILLDSSIFKIAFNIPQLLLIENLVCLSPASSLRQVILVMLNDTEFVNIECKCGNSANKV